MPDLASTSTQLVLNKPPRGALSQHTFAFGYRRQEFIMFDAELSTPSTKVTGLEMKIEFDETARVLEVGNKEWKLPMVLNALHLPCKICSKSQCLT